MKSVWFEYAVSILPIAFGHLIIPPLSFFDFGSDFAQLGPLLQDALLGLYSQIPPEYRSKSFFRSLMYDPEKHRSDILNWLTAMFIHVNYEHLFNNLSSTVSLGYQVHRELGPFLMNSIYIIGGFASFYPIEELYRADMTVKSAGFSWKAIVNDLNAMQRRKALCCGSSGAVCAFLGCNFVFIIRNLYLAAREYLDSDAAYRKRNEDQIAEQVFNNASSLLFITQFVLSEWRLHQRADNDSSSSLIDVFFPKTLIGHLAHLKGFVVGASICSTILYWRKWRKSRSSRL